MEQPPAKPSPLDADLDRIVRTTGRGSIGTALSALAGAGAIMVIRWLAGGAVDALVYLAVAIVVASFAPFLLAAGLIWRKNTETWALDEQRVRDHMTQLETDKRKLEERVHQLEQLLTGSGVRAIAPAESRRGRRPTTGGRGQATGRHRQLDQEDDG
jgi:hypothetical protein